MEEFSVTVFITESVATIGSRSIVVDEDVELDSSTLIVDFEGDPHPKIHNKGIVSISLIIEF